jgi:thiamine biosynthesis lipoprotein ApbE
MDFALILVVCQRWAVHQTMADVEGISPVLVDGGGDIAVSGSNAGWQCLAIGITDQ